MEPGAARAGAVRLSILTDIAAQLSTTASHLAQAMQAFALSPYDLGAGPLFRACVFHIEDGAQTLVLGFHHAVVDGMSITVILRELTHFYEAALDGHKAQLPALVARFQDHAAWQSSPEQYGLRAGARDYWAKRLKGLAGTLDLPRLPSQSAPSNDGKFISLKLGPELASKMETFARDRGATRFMVWLAGYAALLSRFASSDDVPIGVPVANRERPETQGVVGFMVDTVVLRTDLSGAPGFGALVERVRDACRDDLKHKDVPFGEILGLLKLDRSIATTPVFQAAFNFLRLPVLKEQSGDIEVVAKIVELPVARFDLAMELTSIDGDVAGRLEYRLGMFDPAVAQAMANAFGVLLSAAVDAPEQPIESLPLMAQGALSVRTVEAGDAAESAISTLHGLFLARARAQPEAVAIIDVDRTTTYRELDRRSASLAAQLRNAVHTGKLPADAGLP